MQESLLQYLWQFGLFKNDNLKTSDGQSITVIHPGKLNVNEGPDFLEAKIKIDNIEFVGNIELHVSESDWKKHGHSLDKKYQNIILHVVFYKDLNERLGNFPTLDISNYISQETIYTYQSLIQNHLPLPCKNLLENVPRLITSTWMERLMVERWQMKFKEWNDNFRSCGNDFAVLLYQRLAHNFGFKINSHAMRSLAQSIPFTIVERLKENPFQLEALFYGQAGLLEQDLEDDYYIQLRNEFFFLKSKFGLTASSVAFKFLRLRPSNFPTIRISQFVSLLCNNNEFLSVFLNKNSSLQQLMEVLNVSPSQYWITHYTFGKKSSKKIKKLGTQSIQNIIINTIAPFLFFYRQKIDDEFYSEKAIELLQALPSEKNNIINIWNDTLLKPQSAFESQSLLQLYNEYCKEKKCLSCAIGMKIMKNK